MRKLKTKTGQNSPRHGNMNVQSHVYSHTYSTNEIVTNNATNRKIQIFFRRDTMSDSQDCLGVSVMAFRS